MKLLSCMKKVFEQITTRFNKRIPLTTEMLELNGWKRIDLCTFEYNSHKNLRVVIFIPNCPSEFYNSNIPLRYVDELLDRLRHCGENILADNFKIQ